MDFDCYIYDGWDPRLRPAVSRRDWMDAAPEAFAYRCLPLGIANSHGWEALTRCGFSARWNGGPGASDVEIIVDDGVDPTIAPVALFGLGTITFHIAGLFRTPPGWNLWVSGPPNTARDGIVPLTGVIETDWSPYTFTMNWKLTRPGLWVRFEIDEPICHFFPVERGRLDSIAPRYLPIDSAPDLKAQFSAWSASRDAFHKCMRDNPPSRPSDKWQKLYYRGIDATSVARIDDHQSKLNVQPFANAPSAVPTGNTPQALPVPRSNAGCRRDTAVQDTTVHDTTVHDTTAQDTALAKRDWLLASYERLRMLSPETSGLYSYDTVDPEEFLIRHYAANRPAVLKDIAACWGACERWSIDYLRSAIGERDVEFQSDRLSNSQFELEKDAHKRVLPFSRYMDLIETGRAGNDAYITAYNSAFNATAFAPIMDDIGGVPGILSENNRGPAGMLWIGPADTFTPLHHDLTNNLLIQIVGRKRVVLVSPNYTPRLANDRYVFSAIGDLEEPGHVAANFQQAADVISLDVVLEPGDALFLPLGWWHQVRSLDFSVSITHTNFVWPNDFHEDFPS